MQHSPAPAEPAAFRPDLRVIVDMTLLTVVAGAIDAITFLTLGHVFTALVTGNLLFLAFALAGGPGVPALGPAIAVAAFVAGAVVGSLLIGWLGAATSWFSASLLVEALLLGAGGGLAVWHHGFSLAGRPDAGVITFVGVAMGLRGAMALRAAVPGMSTLVIQTPLLRMIGQIVTNPPGHGPGPLSASELLTRIRLTASITAIFLGGVLGALLSPWGTGPALLVVAAAVLVLAAVHAVMLRLTARTRPSGAE
ncbi:YoaK family protein [Streptomyces sp. NPDC047028]|uniref:YoaK family protein n=1 Tax=Streptomyces sp. NPDC047028 TaxID=3155793 RepID=UPI0033DB95E0